MSSKNRSSLKRSKSKKPIKNLKTTKRKTTKRKTTKKLDTNLKDFINQEDINENFNLYCITKITKLINNKDNKLLNKKELEKYCECINTKLKKKNIDKLKDKTSIINKIKSCKKNTLNLNEKRLTKLYSKKYKTYESRLKKK